MAKTGSEKWLILSNLNGGLATRPTPLLVEAGDNKVMRSPAIMNADMFTSGSIAKRLGLTQQGGVLATGAQVGGVNNATQSATVSSSSTYYFAQNFSGVSSAITTVLFWAGSSTSNATVNVKIVDDSGGSPNLASVKADYGTQNINVSALYSTASNGVSFTPSAPTTYWVVFTFTNTTTPTMQGWTLHAGGTTAFKTSTDGSSWSTASTVATAYLFFYFNSVITGVYDYRFGSSSTQQIVACMGGDIYYQSGGTWTSIATGLASSQDSIYSFRTLKNYMFSADYGTNTQRVWNGAASYTIAQGFRPAGTFAQSAGGGTVADGTYKVMLVTTLTSGGYRAGVENTVTIAGGGGVAKIAGTSVVVNNTDATNFGFDAGSTCTAVFMTLAGGSTYYKVATASVSVGNPLPNGTTAFNITAVPAGTENTLLLEYTREQGYFTSQVATPVVKYLEVFQGMLAMAGSSANPSRVWFSQLEAPQIWSTRGGIEGGYIDLDVNDGEVITGLKQWNGNLYAFKRHSVFLIEYTGVASSPFVWKRLSGNIGALSHWAIKEIGSKGLIFFSERGPALCLGTFVTTIPATAWILDRFDPNNSSRYNLSAMGVTTAGNNSTKSQIHFGVSSTSATTRDLTLVYDYENECFWENSISANYYTEVTDSNFFPFVWSGNYSGQISKHDAGTNDNGGAINFYFDTPRLQFGAPYYFKLVQEVYIAGAKQSSGTLYVDVYIDDSTTLSQTLTFDMSNASFKGGLSTPCHFKGKIFKFRVRNSDLDIPVEVDAIGFQYSILETVP